MSVHAIEAFLWEMQNDDRALEQFNLDPNSKLDEFTLSAKERELLIEHDVRALFNEGVEPMLLFTSWIAMRGFDQVSEYMRQLNT